MQTEESIIRLSGDNIIELIRDNRNDLIKQLLNDSSLRAYLEERHQLKKVSAVKLEFIKRSLKELLALPVDLSHYSSLILEMRKSDTATISAKKQQLYFQDIERAIKNYLL